MLVHRLSSLSCTTQPSRCLSRAQVLFVKHSGRNSSISSHHVFNTRSYLIVRAATLDAPVSKDDAREEDEDVNVDEEDEEQLELDTPFGLPLPDERYQRPLDFKTIKGLRSQSNAAAASKELRYIQVGQNGVTQTFLAACMDILAKHEFVRVKLGEGCGLDREETADALERLLDSISVHQIGFTITLYRQKGLPRPSNCPVNNVTDEEQAASIEAKQQKLQVSHKKKKSIRPPRRGTRPLPPRSERSGKPTEFEVL